MISDLESDLDLPNAPPEIVNRAEKTYTDLLRAMPKPQKKPKPTSASPPKATESSTSAELSPEAARQFEVELCWCIQQLQVALNLGKLSPKQVQDHTKALNTLMSRTAPIVKKRQVMRLSFGDYRTKMAAEDKKLSKTTQQIKVSTAKPSAKSVFVRKSTFTSSNNGFAFNFEIPKGSEDALQTDEENGQSLENGDSNAKVEAATENKKSGSSNFHFAPSGNNFKFNFNVPA